MKHFVHQENGFSKKEKNPRVFGSWFFVGGLMISAHWACQNSQREKGSQSVTLDIPKPPSHVSQYVNLSFILHCGAEKFSDTSEASGKIVFKNTAKLTSSSKCYLTARGNPENFKKQHKDVSFKQEQSSDATVFYMSSEMAVKNGQTTAVLYPTFELGSQSQTLVKVKAKLQAGDSKSPAKLADAKLWSLECDGAKAYYQVKSNLEGEAWNLDFQFLKSEIGAQGSGACKLSTNIDSQYYVSDNTVLINAEKNPVADPINIVLKLGTKPAPSGSTQNNTSGNITVEATIE